MGAFPANPVPDESGTHHNPTPSSPPRFVLRGTLSGRNVSRAGRGGIAGASSARTALAEARMDAVVAVPRGPTTASQAAETAGCCCCDVAAYPSCRMAPTSIREAVTHRREGRGGGTGPRNCCAANFFEEIRHYPFTKALERPIVRLPLLTTSLRDSGGAGKTSKRGVDSSKRGVILGGSLRQEPSGFS